MIRYVFENDFEKLLREEAERVHPTSSTRVLNIACEFDLVPKWLPAAIDPRNVSGLEINREIVARVPQIKYCDVDRDRFPFEDDTFDLALSIWGLEHFQHDNLFRETRRVLKTGGRFFAVTPNRSHPIFLASRFGGERLASFYYRRILKSSYTPHRAYYRFNTAQALSRAAEASGLTIASLTYFGPSSVLGYFSFSPALKRVVSWFEKRVLTNRFFYRFKPYLLVVFEKKTSS